MIGNLEKFWVEVNKALEKIKSPMKLFWKRVLGSTAERERERERERSEPQQALRCNPGERSAQSFDGH